MSIEVLLKEIDDLIVQSAPNSHEQTEQKNVEGWLAQVLKGCFGGESFTVGAALNEVILPDEIVEICQLIPSNQCDRWNVALNKALCAEATNAVSPVPAEGEKQDQYKLLTKERVDVGIEEVVYSLRGNFVMANTNRKKFRMSPNDINNLFLAVVLEECNMIIGCDNLLKKSLVLIKLWCMYESKKYYARSLYDVFGHEALTVMTIWIFASRGQQHHQIDHPLRAIIYFLEEFSNFEWESIAVTATSLLPVSTVNGSTPLSPTYLNSTFGASPSTLPGRMLTSGGRPQMYGVRAPAQSLPGGRVNSESAHFQNISKCIERNKERYDQDFLEDGYQPEDQKVYSGRELSRDMSVHSETTYVESFNRSADYLQGGRSPRGGRPVEVSIMDPMFPSRNLVPASALVDYPLSEIKRVFHQGMSALREVIEPLLSKSNSPPRTSPRPNDAISQLFPIARSMIDSRVFRATLSQSMSSPRGIQSAVSKPQPNPLGLIGGSRSQDRPFGTDSSGHTPMDRSTLAGNSDFGGLFTRGRMQLSSDTDDGFTAVSLSPGSINLPATQTPVGLGELPRDNISPLLKAESIIRYAVLVSTSKISTDSVISLVKQVIDQFGPLPIGEIGKQLQLKTGNSELPKILKKTYGGLKKFISSHPRLFRFGDNHNYNPLVYVIDGDESFQPEPPQTPDLRMLSLLPHDILNASAPLLDFMSAPMRQEFHMLDYQQRGGSSGF